MNDIQSIALDLAIKIRNVVLGITVHNSKMKIMLYNFHHRSTLLPQSGPGGPFAPSGPEFPGVPCVPDVNFTNQLAQ